MKPLIVNPAIVLTSLLLCQILLLNSSIAQGGGEPVRLITTKIKNSSGTLVELRTLEIKAHLKFKSFDGHAATADGLEEGSPEADELKGFNALCKIVPLVDVKPIGKPSFPDAKSQICTIKIEESNYIRLGQMNATRPLRCKLDGTINQGNLTTKIQDLDLGFTIDDFSEVGVIPFGNEDWKDDYSIIIKLPKGYRSLRWQKSNYTALVYKFRALKQNKFAVDSIKIFVDDCSGKIRLLGPKYTPEIVKLLRAIPSESINKLEISTHNQYDNLVRIY